MELTVLCSCCNTPLLTTTTERLGWPLHGNMFSTLIPNWTLRDMPLYLEYYCPVCHNFPFYSDGSERGHRGVGRYLNVMVDGRPRMMSVEQIEVSQGDTEGGYFQSEALHPDHVKEVKFGAPAPPSQGLSSRPPLHNEAGGRGGASPGEKPAEFPCPSCGAKKRFHKRGCSVKEAPADPFLDTLEKRVKRGGFNEDANLPPTPEEIADLARDREARSNGRTEPQLRAME